ncbi:hypothetical protein PR048_019568 [Dryococelus australis]|uniref:Uncharacterized protein n=1 Tax=Dryococelus australis TaxID=614101 RepID=A0ABQ9H3Y3_9NEOP|nr:hypothetical protein PR048_019568 [Dryococelus australis]
MVRRGEGADRQTGKEALCTEGKHQRLLMLLQHIYQHLLLLLQILRGCHHHRLLQPQSYQKIKKRRLDTLLVEMVSKDLQTLSDVENQGFKKFIKNLSLVHFFDSSTALKSAVLETKQLTESHTVQYLCSVFKVITEDWGISKKIVCIETEGGANIKAAVNLFDVVAADKLRSIQDQLNKSEIKLKQYLCIRWNSAKLMMERMLVVREPLVAAIASLPKCQHH